MKKIMALLLVLCLAVGTLAACGPTGEEPAAPGAETPASEGEGGIKETLVVGNSATMDSFDTLNVQRAANMYGPTLSHMTLVETDVETKEIVPYLAETFEYNEERNAYIFQLKQNAVFSNGEPVTAEDVVYTFDMLAQSPIGGPLVSCITSAYAEGDYTVVLEVTNPSIEFLNKLTMGNCAILCKSACEENLEEGMKIGCGPYIIKEWVPDEYTLYERVENYWNGTAPSKYIRYQKIAENSSRAIALQTGEIDIDMALSASEVANVEADPNCVVYNESGTALTYLFFNMTGENEAIKDVRVRQAISYAINVDDIIIGAKEGMAEATPYLPNASIDISGLDYTKVDYDLEKARQLMSEAGYADGFELKVHMNSLANAGVEEILQNQLSKIGINLVIACADASQLSTDFASRQGYEMGIYQMTYSNTPAHLGGFVYASTGFVNYSNAGDPAADEALIKVQNSNDEAERQQYAAEFNNLMAEQRIYIPLFTNNALTGARSNVMDLGVGDGSLYLCLRNAYVQQ